MKIAKQFLIGFFVWIAMMQQATAQQRFYEVLPDSAEHKFFRGIVNLSDIKNDTSFKWYAENLKYYKNNADLVSALKNQAGKIQLVLFTGTWCHDSQQITPKYFSCIEAAGFPDSSYTIIASDRAKTTIANLHNVFQAHLVPTIIIMKGGKEFGRIEEFGKTGLPDQELADLLKGL